MIKISNLNFSYDKTTIFSNLNLNIESGNIIGLLGKNGAGKTTLLNIIVGLLNNYDGEVTIESVNTKNPKPSFIQNYYFVPDEISLPNYSVKKWERNYSVFYPNFDHNFFATCLTDFEIDINSICNTLSNGNKKKLALAFAFASNAQLLLLDEPTNGLDIPSKLSFRKKLIEASNEKRTIIVSSHQVKDFENIIDPVIILEDKKIIFNDSIDNIFKNIDFSLETEQPTDNNILMSISVPGGFAVFRKSYDAKKVTNDLEIIFNVLIQKDSQVLKYYEETK